MWTLSLLVALPVALIQCGVDDPAYPLIGPSDAAKYVDRTVTLRMEIKSAASLRSGCYLNSEKDSRNSRNVTVFIDTDGREKLWKERDIRDPADYFNGKIIQVTGTIKLENDRPQMRLSNAEISVVEKK